jgi:hypothetical protein
MATLPPPPVQTVPPVHRDEKLPEPPAPQASQPETGHPTLPDQPVAVIPPPPAPVDKSKQRPKRRILPPVQQAKAEEPAGPPAPENTEPAAKLGQLLTPVQEQSYNQAIDQDLQRAKRNLAIAEGKALTDPQKSVVQQVQSFIKQAEDLRKADMVEAKGLSHKADILASDLARSLQ